jgi:hypothetical protein
VLFIKLRALHMVDKESVQKYRHTHTPRQKNFIYTHTDTNMYKHQSMHVFLQLLPRNLPCSLEICICCLDLLIMWAWVWRLVKFDGRLITSFFISYELGLSPCFFLIALFTVWNKLIIKGKQINGGTPVWKVDGTRNATRPNRSDKIDACLVADRKIKSALVDKGNKEMS